MKVRNWILLHAVSLIIAMGCYFGYKWYIFKDFGIIYKLKNHESCSRL